MSSRYRKQWGLDPYRDPAVAHCGSYTAPVWGFL